MQLTSVKSYCSAVLVFVTMMMMVVKMVKVVGVMFIMLSKVFVSRILLSLV